MAGGGEHDDATNFDLTALLDVLSNIIFFLMASFGAAVVAVLPAALPTISPTGESDLAKEEDKVTLTVRLRADGAVEVKAAGEALTAEDVASLARSFAGAGGRIDAAAVSEHLWGIKERYRASKDVIIVPDGEVTYELLISAMDVTRERPMQVDGKWIYPQMFPAVVVSSLIQ